MKTTTSTAAVVVMAAALSGLAASAAEKSAPAKYVRAQKYIPLTIEGRQEAFAKAKNERHDAIWEMLLLIRESQGDPDERSDSSRVCYAIQTLSLLRPEEAAVPLLDVIDLRFTGGWHGIEAREDPEVIQSLARIGKPASKAAIEYLAKDKSSKRAPMYVRVIFLVEGAEVGKFMVQQAAAAESDPEKKARLTKALALFADADKVVP